MFTGIIKKVEKIEHVRKEGASLFVDLVTPKDWQLEEGQSIAINGVCSTVRKINPDSFEVEYMPETIAKTTVSKLISGSYVNLEQSLRLNDFVDGHLVQGHVDTVGELFGIKEEGNARLFAIKVPEEFIKFIAPKGSITVDGVSLTVVDVSERHFIVSLVGYTLENTNFKYKELGDEVNIETDMMAKYLFNMLKNDDAKKRN